MALEIYITEPVLFERITEVIANIPPSMWREQPPPPNVDPGGPLKAWGVRNE